LNWVIVDAMLTVKESMPTDGTVTEPDDEVAEDDEPAELEDDEEAEDEQPAAVRARAAATATKPALGKRRKYRPPSLLLLTRIPHTLSPGCT
jgi:hypothetical protein